MDAPSTVRCRNGRRIKNLMSKNVANGSRKIRLSSIDKTQKKIISEKKFTGHKKQISTNDWQRNRRSTRIYAKAQELFRNDAPKGENSCRHQMENHGREQKMVSVNLETPQFVSLSRSVTTRQKMDLVADAKITSRERNTSARTKVGFSKNYVNKARLPWGLRSRKVAKKVQCRPGNALLLQNKINLGSKNSNRKLRRRIKDRFYNNGKKACVSQKCFHLGKNAHGSALHDLRIADVSEAALHIENPVFHETNSWPERTERNSPELLKSSEACGNNSLEDAKGIKSCILNSIKLKDDAQQCNVESTVVIPTTRKRKWVSENVGKKTRCESIATQKPSAESLHVDKEKGAFDAGLRDVFDNNVARGYINSMKNLNESDFVAEISEDCSLSDLRNVKLEPSSKWCLLPADPAETGGRQMRPRPLSLDQPLIVLVEGKDQDYFQLDGGMFYKMLQQQAEHKVLFVDKRKINKKVQNISRNGTEKPLQSISVPSFRSVIKVEGRTNKQSPVYMLPKSYTKELLQVQSCTQAEYDIDEVDEEWLYRYNQTVPASSTISVDQLEKIIDLLENRMFNSINLFSEFLETSGKDVEECCICNGGENSADNLILRCADCHICVHQSCYGIQDSEIDQMEMNWHCRKCEAVAKGLEKTDMSCMLCFQQGGALKRATEPHKWAHVTCALYTNETYFIDTDAMEPIEGLDSAIARAKRQRRKCCLCGKKEGCVEKCSVQGCKDSFHVSCGVIQGASFELLHSNEHVTAVRIYCPKHASGTESGNEEIPFPNNYETGGKVQETTRYCKRKSRNGKALNRKNGNGNTTISADSSEENDGNNDFVEGIFLHWLCRRLEQGGPLLHHLQQNHAAKKFNIFNPVDGDVSETSFNSQETGFRQLGFNQTFSMAWNWLKKIQHLSHLVVIRERIKHDLYLTDQGIIEANIQALKTGDTVRLCSTCGKPRLSLICSACNRSTCFFCVKAIGSSRWQSWLNSLKQPKYVCSDCLEQDSKAQREEVTYSSPEVEHCEDNNVAGSKRKSFSADANTCNNGISCSKRKPCLLLPRTDCIHQDRQVTEAFWGEDLLKKKTILVADLLNGRKDTSM